MTVRLIAGQPALPSKRRTRYRSTHDYIAMCERLIRAAGRRVARADADDLAELVHLSEVLDEAILEAVIGLRGDGWTWQSLGESLGVTKQAAVMKWAARIPS